jgi:hypothetical protein
MISLFTDEGSGIEGTQRRIGQSGFCLLVIEGEEVGVSEKDILHI